MASFFRSNVILILVMSWLLCGVVSTAAAFLGVAFWPLSGLLGVPLLVGLVLAVKGLQRWPSLSFSEKCLLGVLVGIWLLHATGVWMPEVGFDAVWYHLPIVRLVAEHHGLIYDPDFYQTLNPWLADSIFLLGYLVWPSVGPKLVAYGLAATLALVSYSLARQFMARRWALVTVIIISSFQVIAWQASSFYVDIAKALWEVAAVWFMVSLGTSFQNKSDLRVAGIVGLLVGASLATKLFSILLVPVFVGTFFLLTRQTKFKEFGFMLLTAALLAVPFYFRTYYYTSAPFLSINLHLAQLGEIGGNQSITWYLWERIRTLPLLLATLTFFVRDYVTILFLVFLPLLLLSFREFIANRKMATLLFFSVSQLVIWWFIPPLSTRYALSGFITATIVYMWVLVQWMRRSPKYQLAILMTIGLATGFNLAPRLVVTTRNMEYFWKRPPIEDYIPQFYDGIIDGPLKTWYQLP